MIYLLINHKMLSYNGYYNIINSANIKKNYANIGKTMPISILTYFFYIGRAYYLYCKDSLGCIDNNNIELINNMSHCGYLYIYIYIFLLIAQDLLAGTYFFLN